MTTLNLQVGASSDDAFENAAGTVTLTGVSLNLNAAGHWAGWRFTSVNIPNSATVTTATFQIYIVSTSNDNVHGDFYAEAVDDSSTFTTAANNISTRSLTTAKTTLALNNVGAGWYSINVTSAVQEVISRSGRSGGEALSIILDAATSIDIQTRTWDHDTSLAAKLDIDYTVPTTGLVIPRRARTYIRM